MLTTIQKEFQKGFFLFRFPVPIPVPVAKHTNGNQLKGLNGSFYSSEKVFSWHFIF